MLATVSRSGCKSCQMCSFRNVGRALFF